jgi:hypothetical protein
MPILTFIENVESDSDENIDQTTSNVRRQSPSLLGENITIISKPEFLLGKDKITKWYKNNSPSNIRTRRRKIFLHLPGVERIARMPNQSWIAGSYFFLIL